MARHANRDDHDRYRVLATDGHRGEIERDEFAR